MADNAGVICDDYYDDLIREYRLDPEESFLHRYFWADGMEGLLKKVGGELPGAFEKAPPEVGLSEAGDEKLAKEIGVWLRDAMRRDPERARGLLLRKAPTRKEHRDFWEELWLNDAGYRAGLITDVEYYVWLVEYLVARDKYYSDKGNGVVRDGHTWLRRLLMAGLRGTEHALTAEMLKNSGKKQVKSNLRRLAKLLQSERDEGEAAPGGLGKAAGRLHKLMLPVKGKDEGIEYLRWLTYRLKKMALHVKIKTRLQDSGHPLKYEGKTGSSKKGSKKDSEKAPEKASRKQDFSLKMFGAYLDQNYTYVRKDMGGVPAQEMWEMQGPFCAVKREFAEALMEEARQDGNDNLYIPLAVHVYTGCTFFLAGKQSYETVYEKQYKERKDKTDQAEQELDQDEWHWKINPREEYVRAKNAAKKARKEFERAKKEKEQYEKSEECCCFDYLRLDEAYADIRNAQDAEPDGESARQLCDVGGGLRMQMQPLFHENAGKDYETVFDDFKHYCVTEESGTWKVMKGINGDMPQGVPSEFRWAYEAREEDDKT